MAGSYGHVDLIDGSWEMIENMGDAYECTEQLLWLCGTLAQHILRENAVKKGVDPGGIGIQQIHEMLERMLDRIYYPMVRGEKPADQVLQAVKRVMGE